MYGKIENGKFSQAPSVVVYQSQKYMNPTNAILEALGYLPVVDDLNTKPQSGENINDYTISYVLDDVNNQILKVYKKKPVILTEDNYSTYMGTYIENSISGYVNEHKSEWTIPTEGDELIPQSLTLVKTKLVYNQDEIISLDDLIVTCNYTNNTSANILNYTTNINEISTAFAGYKILKVTYVHNGISVSNTIGITVNNTDSYNNIQLAYKIAKSGILTNDIPIVSTTDKLIQYGTLHLRLKAKFVVEQNDSTTSVKIGFGDNSVWGTDYINKYVMLNAREVGEFDLDIDTTIEFNRASVNADEVILKLHTNSKKIQGYFELQDVSLAYTVQVPTAPISITASKIQTRAIIGETVTTDDITATVTYNNGTSAEVTPQIIEPNEYNIGSNNITVSYSEASHTVTTTITMQFYQQDKTVADPFTDMTAKEWCETYCHKAINWGNELDTRVNGMKIIGDETHIGDNHMNQETLWGQPIATLKNFQDIKAAGFDCVRIPVTWCYNSYTEPELNADGLKVRHIGKFWACRVREVVDYALEAGLSVMLNMHHEMMILFTGSTNIAMKQVYLDAQNCWTEIAEKFKHYDQRLMFEGYNEVDNIQASFQFGQEAAEQMNRLNQIFVDAVRSTGSNNSKRILACPTTVHMSAPIALEAWNYPVDIADNLIVLAVHCYSQRFAQDLNWNFSKIEQYSISKNAPVMITEWGTTDKEPWDFRVIHAQNYAARAKYYGLYPMWWDNGSDYELVKKYNTIHDQHHSLENLQRIIDAIDKGYSQMKAYELPSSQIKSWNDINEFHLLNWSLEKGYYASGWGTASTDIFSVEPNKNFIFSVDKTGTAVDAVMQLATINFLKQVYDEDTQTYEYVSIEKISPAWHVAMEKGVVPADADCCLISINCADHNIKTDQWNALFTQDELELSMILYVDSDITEVTLEPRHPVSLNLTKENVIYALNDELVTNDITVELVYNDGFSEILDSSKYTIDTSNVDMTTVGAYDITVTSNGITDNITIFVGDVLMSISSDSKLSCKVGGQIDVSSMVITATYTDGTSKEVTDYTVDTSEVNANITGNYTIHVTYVENGVTTTCDLDFLVYDNLQVTGIDSFNRNVTGDFTEEGWALTMPSRIELSSRKQYNQSYVLTDSEHAYADVLNAKESYNYHLFIPKVPNKMVIVNTWMGSFTASDTHNWSSNPNPYYDFEVITDSIGREWYKIYINDSKGGDGYIGNGKAFITNSSIPIYYATENNLGSISPEITSW